MSFLSSRTDFLPNFFLLKNLNLKKKVREHVRTLRFTYISGNNPINILINVLRLLHFSMHILRERGFCLFVTKMGESRICYYLIRKSKNLCSAFHNAFALSVCSNCCRVCFDCIGISLVSWSDKVQFRTYLINSYERSIFVFTCIIHICLSCIIVQCQWTEKCHDLNSVEVYVFVCNCLILRFRKLKHASYESERTAL